MKIGLEKLELFGELEELKNIRTTKSIMFLYHGTKTNLNIINTNGN